MLGVSSLEGFKSMRLALAATLVAVGCLLPGVAQATVAPEGTVLGSDTDTSVFEPIPVSESTLIVDCIDNSGQFVSCPSYKHVVTGWSIRAGATGGEVALKVYEDVGSSTGKIVAESDVETALPDQLNEFDTRIPLGEDTSDHYSDYGYGVSTVAGGVGPELSYSSSTSPDAMIVTTALATGDSFDMAASAVSGRAVNLDVTVERDVDGDGYGDDTQDTDDDGDGVSDSSDNCQVEANADQVDDDGDGIGDACDSGFNAVCLAFKTNDRGAEIPCTWWGDEDAKIKAYCEYLIAAHDYDMAWRYYCDGAPTSSLTDSDGDGIPDVIEDTNGNGKVDSGETNPQLSDTDSDRLKDGVEDANQDGLLASTETDPLDSDTDNDKILDGIEDADQDGSVDAAESNPLSSDTDSDGLDDSVEDADRDGVRDRIETSAVKSDTDNDKILDGVEDRDRDGIRDRKETSPIKADSDRDGLKDGVEDRDRDGRRDIARSGRCKRLKAVCKGNETSATRRDTDRDGKSDKRDRFPLNGKRK